jgi:L-ascorbate metabolism protein UlaG (beta-lactamase superfamily)
MLRRLLLIAVAAFLALVIAVVAFVLVQANRRPSMDAYPVLPAATDNAAVGEPNAAVRVRYAGVATLLFDDGETAWMTDGFFTRPSLARTAFTRIAPDRAAVTAGLQRLGVTRLAAVVPVHSHYDHAMDSPLVAMATGALLVGSESTLNIGRGLGMREDHMRRVRTGERLVLGRWTLTFVEGRHVPLPISGGGAVETVDVPLVPPAHSLSWKEGQTWAIHVAHASGVRMLVLGSAGFVPGSLAALRAETVFLGIGSVGKQPREYRAQWWSENVRMVGAKRVVPIHWDDFGEPLDRPLVAFPYLVDDVGATMRDLAEWAARDGVELRLPPAFAAFGP